MTNFAIVIQGTVQNVIVADNIEAAQLIAGEAEVIEATGEIGVGSFWREDVERWQPPALGISCEWDEEAWAWIIKPEEELEEVIDLGPEPAPADAAPAKK